MSMPTLGPGRRVRVQVPATSANLGPAFDAAGLALGLFDEVEVETTRAGCTVEVSGEGADDLPRDEAHLVVRAVREGLRAVGADQPGLRLRAINRIPHGRGLGSSAAATVAGLLAARGLCADDLPGLDDRQVLALAIGFEGHGDNVAACLHGGLSLVWVEGTTPRVVRVPLHPSVVPVVLVPSTELSTDRARGLLPESVPHRVAAHAAGRAALLVHALGERPDLLLAATEDRLHQPYRASAFPESMAVVRSLRDGGHAAVISGAGPSVLVLATRESAGSVPVVGGWARLEPGVASRGAQVSQVVAA